MNLDNYDLFYMLMGETNWKSALVLVWNKFNYGLTLNKNPENKLNQFSYTIYHEEKCKCISAAGNLFSDHKLPSIDNRHKKKILNESHFSESQHYRVLLLMLFRKCRGII